MSPSVPRVPLSLGFGRLLGHRFLLLIHIGRRTGLRHQAVLEVMEYRKVGPELVVMSGFGRNSDWLRNIEAAQTAEIIVGSQHLIVSHRFLCDEEAMEVVRNYESRNRITAPIIHRVLSSLLGWRYSGSEADRRRLVDQLPLLAFQPRS